MIKKLLRKALPNPYDALIKKAMRKSHSNFLFVWNRGLGDIALGLYAMVHRLYSFIPGARITFITREDLAPGFKLLSGVNTLVSKQLIRGKPFSLNSLAQELNLNLDHYNIIIEKPDPTYWVKWQLGKLQPQLRWQEGWNETCEKFDLENTKDYIGLHVNSETSYGYNKNWPSLKWHELIKFLEKKNQKCLIFGNQPKEVFPYSNVIDLRGKTNLIEALSLIKNRCKTFIGPDSGILSLLYFLDEPFALKAISLWADSAQGILKQNVISPNPLLEHVPLLAPNQDLQSLSTEAVLQCL